MACSITLEKGRHIVIKDGEGAIVKSLNGSWLIMDTQKNELVYVPPSDEVVKFFGVQAEPKECHEVDGPRDEPRDEPTCVRWERNAILNLLSLCKENIANFKSTSMKNEHVWKLITEKMTALGFKYSKIQIENKFKYLKARYIKKKDNMSSRATGDSPVTFDYFDEFDEMFGKQPNIEPVAVASSAAIPEECVEANCDSDSNEPPKKKSRLEKEVSLLSSVINTHEKQKEEAKERRHTERQQITQHAIDVYEKMMQKLIDKL